MFKNLIKKLKKSYNMYRYGYNETDKEIENYLLSKDIKLCSFCGFPVITYYKWLNGSAIRYFIAYNLKYKKILEFRVPNWYEKKELYEFKNLKTIKNISNFKDLVTLETEFLKIIENKNLEQFDTQIKHFNFEVERVYKKCMSDDYFKKCIRDKLFDDEIVKCVLYGYRGLEVYRYRENGFSFKDLNVLTNNLKKLRQVFADNLYYFYDCYPELLISSNLNKN